MAQHEGYGYGRLLKNTPTWVLLIVLVILSILLYLSNT